MRKKTTEVVREEFRKEGYKLLGEYVNSHTKISFICPKGHKHSIQWGNWSQGQRCNYCSKRPIKGSEQVRESFIKEGFILPEDWEYVNSSVKIPYVCSSGHEGAIAWNNWQKGSRCALDRRNHNE